MSPRCLVNALILDALLIAAGVVVLRGVSALVQIVAGWVA